MLQRMAQAPVGIEVFVMLRLIVATMFCAMTSGCAGYQALIIPKPVTATGATVSQQSGVRVCEGVGVRERRCEMIDRRQLQELFERTRMISY
jgi:hypothetical protein